MVRSEWFRMAGSISSATALTASATRPAIAGVLGCTALTARGAASLQAGTHRRDPLRIEAEPVHASDVTSVLDLQAAVDDHGEAAVLRDPDALLVDHTELAPEGARVDRHRVACELGQRIGRPENVHDVHRDGDVIQARVTRLAQDLLLARV